jgi:hypothetical protein
LILELPVRFGALKGLEHVTAVWNNKENAKLSPRVLSRRLVRLIGIVKNERAYFPFKIKE